MMRVSNNFILHSVVFWIFFFCIPFFSNAAEGGFVPLVGIPGITDPNSLNMQQYINTLLTVSIIAAALIAVVKLIYAGAQYILSGIVTDKENAKKDIRGALVGLLIVLSAVAILRTINPDLLNLPSLEPAPTIDRTAVPISLEGRTLEEKGGGLECLEGSPGKNAAGEAICISNADRDSEVLLSSNNTEFNFVPLDDTSFIDARENHPDLRDVPLENIIGYLELDPRTEGGRNLLKEYDNLQPIMEAELLKPSCGSNNRLIIVKKFNITGYYCVKRN